MSQDNIEFCRQIKLDWDHSFCFVLFSTVRLNVKLKYLDNVRINWSGPNFWMNCRETLFVRHENTYHVLQLLWISVAGGWKMKISLRHVRITMKFWWWTIILHFEWNHITNPIFEWRFVYCVFSGFHIENHMIPTKLLINFPLHSSFHIP